jgi:uncharacterized protein (TIGR00251 family)
LSIRVQPRSRKNAVAGWIGDTVKLCVTAPPVEGAANTACLSLLSTLLDVPLSRLALVKGGHSRNKVVRIIGLSDDEVRACLSRPSCP